MAERSPYPVGMYPGCPCYACDSPTWESEITDFETGSVFHVKLRQRMSLCPQCGNKRCPGAADHRNACTGSNEPGQPGSLYA